MNQQYTQTAAFVSTRSPASNDVWRDLFAATPLAIVVKAFKDSRAPRA